MGEGTSQRENLLKTLGVGVGLGFQNGTACEACLQVQLQLPSVSTVRMVSFGFLAEGVSGHWI